MFFVCLNTTIKQFKCHTFIQSSIYIFIESFDVLGAITRLSNSFKYRLFIHSNIYNFLESFDVEERNYTTFTQSSYKKLFTHISEYMFIKCYDIVRCQYTTIKQFECHLFIHSSINFFFESSDIVNAQTTLLNSLNVINNSSIYFLESPDVVGFPHITIKIV